MQYLTAGPRGSWATWRRACGPGGRNLYAKKTSPSIKAIGKEPKAMSTHAQRMVAHDPLQTRNGSGIILITCGLGTANFNWTSHSHQSPKCYPMASSHWQSWVGTKGQKVSWIPGAQCYSVIHFVPLSLGWKISPRVMVLRAETQWCSKVGLCEIKSLNGRVSVTESWWPKDKERGHSGLNIPGMLRCGPGTLLESCHVKWIFFLKA